MSNGKRYKEDSEKPLDKEQEELQQKYKEMLLEIGTKNKDTVEDKSSIDDESNTKSNDSKEHQESINTLKEEFKKPTDLILEKIENEAEIEKDTIKLNEIKEKIEKLEKEALHKDDEIVILSEEKVNEIKEDVLFQMNSNEKSNEETQDNANEIERSEELMETKIETIGITETEVKEITEEKIDLDEKETTVTENKDKNDKKDKKDKKKQSKTFKVIGTIIYYLVFLFILFVLALVAIQRFSNNELSIGGYRMFNIITGSMEPEYSVADVLISKEIEPEDIQLGDDIVYLGKVKPFTDLIVTHRVVDLNKESDGTYSFITRGIANDIDDPVITETQVLGKIIYKVKSFTILSKAINNMYVFFFVIFVPVVILVSIKIIQVKHEKKEEYDE